MKRFFAVFLVLLMIFSISACGGNAPEQPKGLILKAPPDVRVILSAGFKEGLPVKPVETYEEGEHFVCYRYEGLNGAYRIQTSGLGYYDITRNIVIDGDTNISLDVTPEKKAGTGWEATEVQLFADTLLNGAFSDDIAQWPEYADVFTTPWFTQSHGEHQITTQTQMEDYLKSLDSADDDLYLYSAGITGTYRYDIPLAVLTKTDLSETKTLEEMAQALQNGKPTVLYRAQVHGTEPASGEAALAAIGLLDGRWGSFLENMNVCVIPRSTPDSAQNFTRYVGSSIEPNQDCLRLKTDEVESFINLCRLLMPEVIIDGHEYQCHVVDEVVEGGDILVGIGYTVENTGAFREMGLEMAAGIFEATEKNGLTSRYYTDVISTAGNANGSRSYAANMGSIFFLQESRGIGMGTSLYPRRIISHITSLESLLTYVNENPVKVLSTVAAERDYIVADGSTYDEMKHLVLETKSVENEELTYEVASYEQLTGDCVRFMSTPKEMSNITKSVPAPTAYVIPAGESFTSNVLKRLDQHGIAYTQIPAGSKVMLQQYSEEGLLEEQTVVFPDGAYVICKNQVQSRNLSNLMEPQFPNHGETAGTFVAQGIISAQDGKYPLYRYIHDLNENGFIDYKH